MAPFLGIELRFRVDPRVVPWAHTIAGVLAWEPELAPTHLDPFARRTRADVRRAREVGRWLGIEPGAPLRIVPPR